MARRLAQNIPWFEGRGAEVRRARIDYPCDIAGCGQTIRAGRSYVYVNTGIRACNQHFEPADIEEGAR